MPEIKLKIEDLVLDHDNPRISHAAGQREALQKVVQDQKTKLVKLAQSITSHGLNPMDRLLVVRLNQTPRRYFALEGNRRVAVFKLLTNPAVMGGLDMPAPMKRILEGLAKNFKKTLVEPLPCFELPTREAGTYWLKLRHSIGHDGAGIDAWKSMAKRRFEGKPPVVQALELVTERAGLSKTESEAITDKFPTSTLERFLENTAVRQELGFNIKDGKLVSNLPGTEIAKPLKRIVLDLATKRKRVGSFMKTDDMLKYIREELTKDDRPDLSKARKVERTFEQIPASDFAKAKSTRRKQDPSDRRYVVPKGCPVHVTDNRISEIYKELRSTLTLVDSPNAIAVLLRVFLELSVDHFLEANNISLERSNPSGGGTHYKSLQDKVREVVDLLVSMKVNRDNFNAVIRSLSDKSSALHPAMLHAYVHDRFETPSVSQLKAAWDKAQPLFERIWPNG